jgi:hypothetical protein
MCNAFSCVVLENGSVLWEFGVDSHDNILEENNIPDEKIDADFCRVEISPNNKNYLKPYKWVFRIDQKPVPNWMEEEHEKACWNAFREWKSQLDKILVYKEIVNPFSIIPPDITDEHIELLRRWDSVWNSVGDSVWASVWNSVGDSVWDSVWDSVRASVWDSVRDSVMDSVRDSVGDSVRASVWDSVMDSIVVYIGSFFNIQRESWKYTEKINCEGYPFQSAVKLWEMGLVPSFDGEKWRLHSKKDVVWEGVIR